jgi:hypothetical protein
VPQVLVVLGSFPLNNNGKIERKKLPAPDYTHIASAAGVTPLQNDIERAIADVWSEVLGLPAVSFGVESGNLFCYCLFIFPSIFFFFVSNQICS